VAATSTSAPRMTAPPPPTTAAFEPLNSESRAGANGVGGVLVGMTLDQAEHAARMPITYERGYAGSAQCAYAEPVGGPTGLTFMLQQGRIVRYDVGSGSILTFSGVGIGSTESAVLAAYGSQITVEPDPTSGGHLLEYTPKSSANSAYRMTFQTDGSQVISFRGGYATLVGYAEGCV
jgi:hypothetical protein